MINNDFLEHICNLLDLPQGQFPRLYLVGGAIRDQLLGKKTKDIDIVCRNAKIFSEFIAREKKATVVAFEKKAHEPCYRIIQWKNKGFVVDISEMRGNSINQDLALRDFTINAMAVEITIGGVLPVLIDPLGGRNDLKNNLIRLCSDHAIKDDPLRILRAIRFCSELGFTLEKDTEISIGRQASFLRESAPERVMSELIQIFGARNCISLIQKMDQLGLLEVVFPEIQPMKSCTQNTYHHQDVWKHSLSVLEHLEIILNHPEKFFEDSTHLVLEYLGKNDRIPLLKMAALFHDIGKPDTRAVSHESGKITFYGHDARGKEIISDLATRLKMSQKKRALLEMIAAEHLRVVSLSKSGVKKNTIIGFFRKLGDDALLPILLSMADMNSKMGPQVKESNQKAYLNWCRKIISEYFSSIKNQLARKNLINGKDLIKMGVAPGPEMGKILKKIREAQDSGDLRDRKQALDYAMKIKAML